MKTILRIENLSKHYKEVTALSGINLEVKKGEFVSIIGRSGAGKSTLLRCINRMVEPSAGQILFEDLDVSQLRKRDLRKVRAKIGMIFQHYNLVYRQSVIENVLHGRLGLKSTFNGVFSIYTNDEKLLAVNIIEKLGLTDQMYKRCDALSGGQKQRVGIARALIQNPTIILCDEPIASLDPGSAKVIMDHLRQICDDTGITIIVNLHQVDVAVKYADRIVGINGGNLVYDGSPKKLAKKTIHEIYGSDEGELLLD